MAGCGSDAGVPAAEGLQVVTTIGMLTDAAERVGGARVSVTGLMGPGVDPHLFRASAGDVRRLAAADLILYGGLHLEAAMGEVLEEMGRGGRTVPVLERLDPALLLPAQEGYPGQFDPHLWFDVGLWARVVEVVAEALAAADPEGGEFFRGNARSYVDELEELDRWVRERLETVPPQRRILITAHDAFHYFERAYGFQVRGLQGVSTVTEAGARDVQALAALIVERGIPAIFVESSVPRRTIEAVRAAARARGADVRIGGELFSDAMGSRGTPEGSYPGMVRHNVNTIVQGLTTESAP